MQCGEVLASPDLLTCVIDIDTVISSKTTAYFDQTHIVTTHEVEQKHWASWQDMCWVSQCRKSQCDLSFLVCKTLGEIRRFCSCLPRECSQTMFIVLGGFQGERAGNDGSWSPGEIVASKEDAGMWRGGWWEKEKRKKMMTWHDTWGGGRKDSQLTLEESDYSCTCRDCPHDKNQ